jgi:LmbE family N-acetylglucosaminyl deacetylase
MELIVDGAHLGTPESVWQQSGRLDGLPPLAVGLPRGVVVVAPHPDDEVLGAGGLIQHLVRSGVEVEVLAVTDGERSHPTGGERTASILSDIRPRESLLALRRLCSPAPTVTRLGLPDGRVGDHEERLADALRERSDRTDLWLAPWRSDGHPDHDVCGRVASEVAEDRRVRSLSFLVWAWHWADPFDADVPWEQCRRFELDQSSLDRKRLAIQAFRSQILAPGITRNDEPVLPPAVLARLQRKVEVFVDEGIR